MVFQALTLKLPVKQTKKITKFKHIYASIYIRSKVCIIENSKTGGQSLYNQAPSYKTYFMLNSAEHEISNAHKYENIQKFSIFRLRKSLEYYFSCS